MRHRGLHASIVTFNPPRFYTDADLTHMRKLTGLTELNLVGTKVTDAGVQELQKALPNVKITR